MVLQLPASKATHVIIVASPKIRTWALEVVQSIEHVVPIEAPSAFLAARRTLELPTSLVLLGQETPCFRMEMGVRLVRQVCPSVMIVGVSWATHADFVHHFFRAGGNLLLNTTGAPLSSGLAPKA